MIRSTRVTPLSVTAVIAAALVTVHASQQPTAPVVVTAVVTTSDGQPVRGLTQADFSVREDDRTAAITGFRAITEVDAATNGRTIVVLLGSGSAPDRTSTVQDIARSFLNLAGRSDRVSAVRFGKEQDELSAPRPDMLMRIAEFRTLTAPPVYDKTQEDVMKAIADIARDLRDERIERQAIVWVGPAAIVNVIEPALGRHERRWPYWVDALSEGARSRVSVYAVDPHGLYGRLRLPSPDGLVAQTGGAIIDNTNDLTGAVQRIWSELGSYYVLEYAGSTMDRDLHEIEVTVNRRDVTVRATKRR